MGRMMMSYLLPDDEVAPIPDTPQKLDVNESADGSTNPYFIEKWSASNAFDPDSDEFWEGQEIIHEAFVDVHENELTPTIPNSPSSRASSDSGVDADDARMPPLRVLAVDPTAVADAQAAPSMVDMHLSPEEREVARRERERERSGRGSLARVLASARRHMQSRQAQAQMEMHGLAIDPSQLYDQDNFVAQHQQRARAIRAGGELPPLVPIHPTMHPMALDMAPSTPQPQVLPRPQLWSDLRQLSHSPLPLPQTPTVYAGSPSPAPTVTPHMYNWGVRTTSMYNTNAPPSPSPAHARASASHRRRESLPTTISLMG